MINNMLWKYFSNKIYGGTNHDNPIYGPFNFKRNRKGQHYLASENANPMIVIPQSSPLSVREFTKPEAVFGLVNICVEDGTKNIDFLPNYENYERIIVSRIYAEAAKKYFSDNLSYLDRLVTPVPLYNKEPEIYNDTEKIGCAFLTRVIPVLEPRYYLEELKKGAHPSILSIADAISQPTVAGAYPKLLNDMAVHDLRMYLEYFLQSMCA